LKQKAFTLIEVIIALAIISIALFAITYSISESIATQQHIKQVRIEILQQSNQS